MATTQEFQEEKARRFAEIYVFEKPGNMFHSYKQMAQEFDLDVNDSSASKNATRYFRKDIVQKWVAYYRAEARKVHQIDKEEIVANLKEMAFNPDKSDKTRLAAIKSLIDMGGYKTENHNIDTNQTIEVVIE